ncbi:MAG: hypothetical protein HFG41_09565 [Coprococcus sp.]|nr:hypothetical protein [Coprococcus sp.]
MLEGIGKRLTLPYKKNASVQTNQFAFQRRLVDSAIQSDHSLNGKHATLYMNFGPYLEEWNTMQELANNPAADLKRLQLEQYLTFWQKQNMSGRIGNERKEKKNGLNLLGTNVTQEVREAWDKAEKEAGMNGAAMEADGKLSALTELFAMSLEKFYKEGNSDILGSTEESARAAVQKALERMGIPETEAEKREKIFYEAFLRYL